jgi:hypothetical protein
MVAALGLILTIIFAAISVYFRSRGGYRAVHITEGASIDKVA